MRTYDKASICEARLSNGLECKNCRFREVCKDSRNTYIKLLGGRKNAKKKHSNNKQ